MDARITQEDVARKARVHRTTVSLALKDHPGIPAKTKARIRRIADTLGYAPDPMLSALNAYRTRKRPASFQGTLAWMVRTTGDYDWRKVLHYRDYYEGAAACARRYGFHVETFELGAPQMEPTRLARVLRTRNITGLLVCPQPLAHVELEFPWESFSAVAFSYTVAKPCLHTVATNHYHAMVRIMRELRGCGYRRPGFAIHHAHNARTDDNYLAAYLVGCDAAVQAPAVPPLITDALTPSLLGRWIERHQPDALVSGDPLVLQKLRELKIEAPRQLGVACPCLPRPDRDLSGMVDSSMRIGAVAVDTLVAMLNRGERGIPEEPLRIHVEGRWNPGRTLRSPADHSAG